MNRSDNRRFAVVTGARGDIGSAISQHLERSGLQVIEVDVIAAETQSGRISVVVDLCDTDATRDCAAQIAAEYSPLTFVHCAGRLYEDSLDDVLAEDVEAAYRLAAGAAIWFSQAMLPAMKASHFGRIVLVGSRAMLGLPKRTAYSASKASLAGLVRTWALELGEFGVTVNLVSPGPVDTRMLRAGIPADSSLDGALRARIPLKRLGTPDDVARAVAFFTNPANGWITGQNLFVCGGTSVGSL
jgi:NAD(P)-dependent dehydrogenase (short-subunit alcohol dehydrogenase family)